MDHTVNPSIDEIDVLDDVVEINSSITKSPSNKACRTSTQHHRRHVLAPLSVCINLLGFPDTFQEMKSRYIPLGFFDTADHTGFLNVIRPHVNVKSRFFHQHQNKVQMAKTIVDPENHVDGLKMKEEQQQESDNE